MEDMEDLNKNITKDPQTWDNSSKEKAENQEIDYAKEVERLKKENEKIKSKYERNKERLKGEQTRSHFSSLSIVDLRNKAMDNPLVIVELNETDPLKAERVAKSCGFRSYDDFINDPDYSDDIKKVFPDIFKTKESSEEEIEARVMEKLEKKQISKIVWTLDEKVKSEFEDITEGKNLTLDNLDKYIAKAEKLAWFTSSSKSPFLVWLGWAKSKKTSQTPEMSALAKKLEQKTKDWISKNSK